MKTCQVGKVGLAPAPVQLALRLGHQAPYLKTVERGQAHLPNLRGYLAESRIPISLAAPDALLDNRME